MTIVYLQIGSVSNFEGAQDMPAVKWKLANLAKMKDEKHKQAVHQLKKIIVK